MRQPTIDTFSKLPILIVPTHGPLARPSEPPIEELFQGVSLELEEAQSSRPVRKYRNLPKKRNNFETKLNVQSVLNPLAAMRATLPALSRSFTEVNPDSGIDGDIDDIDPAPVRRAPRVKRRCLTVKQPVLVGGIPGVATLEELRCWKSYDPCTQRILQHILEEKNEIQDLLSQLLELDV